MSPLDVALILFGIFVVLVMLRVPVAFALGLACVPVFFIDERLTPFLLLNEMLKAYNSFLLLAIPFTVLVVFTLNVLLHEFGAADFSGTGAANASVTGRPP